MQEIIAASGLTHREVSERLGVSLRAVDNWCMSGESHRNPPEAMVRLAEMLLKP
jgi:transposase